MRNLLQMIVKYSNFLLFLLLEIAALALLFANNGYQRTVWMTSTGRVTGQIYAVVNSVSEYFNLKQENEDLVAENIRLQDEITRLQNVLEPYAENDTTLLYADCNRYVYAHKAMHYVPAKVVHAELGMRKNNLTINKGARDGIEQGFGVVDQRGVVGIVSVVNESFSLVMPLINTKMQLSCRMKGTTTFGPLMWDGKDAEYAHVRDLPRHSGVQIGDTVVTSGLTTTFPEGILVGVVDDVVMEANNAYYSIRVKLAADFTALGYVQVICNEKMREEKELVKNNTSQEE